MLGVGILYTSILHSQISVNWVTLDQVSFVPERDLATGKPIEMPIYSSGVKALSGQYIQITGYIIPMDVQGDAYALSGNPYASCFFCGGGSRASVMELQLQDYSHRYKLDQRVTFIGQLNLTPVGDGLIYVLRNASPVSP